MSEDKSSVSGATSYQEMGEYWDGHDLADVWDQTEPVEIELDLESDRRYYPIELTMAKKISELAKRQGVSAETLLNLWVKEKLVTAMETTS